MIFNEIEALYLPILLNKYILHTSDFNFLDTAKIEYNIFEIGRDVKVYFLKNLKTSYEIPLFLNFIS